MDRDQASLSVHNSRLASSDSVQQSFIGLSTHIIHPAAMFKIARVTSAKLLGISPT